MGNGQGGWIWKTLATGLAAMVLIGSVVAQDQPRRNRGRLRDQGGDALKKVRPQGGDPLAPQAKEKGQAKDNGVPPAVGTYHYTFKLHSFDGTVLAASYYPSKLASSAPAVVLIHEVSRSRKDFEEPVAELKGQGFAEHLQRERYAVVSVDLRGQGQNPRHELNANDRASLVSDLQAVYMFLLDRHNRGDLNVGKLGVLGLGAGGNLAAAWAFQPGAAVSVEGEASDLNALALISPLSQGSGYSLRQIIPQLAPKVPIALLTGGKDEASKDAVESVRGVVERERLSKIELFPSSLSGYKLLRLEPKVTGVIMKFLEGAIKLRAVEWEPRYNLTPVTVSDITIV